MDETALLEVEVGDCQGLNLGGGGVGEYKYY